MKVLIADKLSESTLAALKEIGVEPKWSPELSADELPQEIPGFDVLVVRSTKVHADTIDAADNLSLIVRAGAGVNNIDVAAASAKGIYVANCPGMNSAAVAELTMGLLIACDRRICDASIDLRAGQWNKKKYSEASGLKGRTLGILGLGMIGQAVAQLAQSLGMKVIAWSRSLTEEQAEALGVQRADSPLEVAGSSDAVTIHLAACPETKHLIDSKFLDAMPAGGILINTSRGDVVDAVALKEAIHSKGLRVGLDVFENEPASGAGEFADTELAGMVTCTPHIGASTDQASESIAAKVVEIIREFYSTGRPTNVVNWCERSSATHSMVIRHLNRVGVLATILDALRDESINVEEMENSIFEGDSAACCTLQLSQAPSEDLVEQLSGHPHVLQLHVKSR